MAAVRPLRAGFAVDVDAARATAFASLLSIQLGWRLEASTSPAAAVAASDICVTCTTTASPRLFAEHLHAGLFVAAVGADNPAKQEIWYFVRLGSFGFGGPAALVGSMRRDLVEDHRGVYRIPRGEWLARP